MKKFIITTTLLAMCATSSINANSSMSTEELYMKVGGFMGIGGKTSKNPNAASTFNNMYGETQSGLFGGIGFNASENVTAEILIEYNNGPEYKSSTGKLVTTGFAGFINASVKSMEFGPAAILLGGGLGASMMETKDGITPATYIDDFALAWNVGGSVQYTITSEYALEAGYRFANYGKPGNSGATPWAGDDRTSHNIFLGLNFNL